MDPIKPVFDTNIPEIKPLGPGRGPAAQRTGPGSFGEVLESAIDSVNKAQGAADEATRSFALGENQDLHTLLLQVERADLSFRTMMEVRNKLLEAYREVMRMQI